MLDAFLQFFPWGVATVIAVLAGIMWQGRQRQGNINKPKRMQSNVDLHLEHHFSEDKASTDPSVAHNKKDEEDHPLRFTKKSGEKTSMDRPVGQHKVTEHEKDRPPRLAHSLMPKSDILSAGTPVVYKLQTELKLKREKGKIIKKSVGSPRDLGGRGTEKVLMVVGATGAGKTTLINGMVNYILGVEWADEFRFKLVVEDSEQTQAHSQTKEITAYTFHPMEGSAVPYTFTIIDTPGFGDTEGLKRDKEITNQIKEFFLIPPPNGIDHLDGVGFVTQAPLARLTPTQEYIFTSILSIFGKDVAKNIFILITFADAENPPVMEAIKKANIPAQEFHKFNNSAIFANNTKTAQKNEDREDEDEDEHDFFNQMCWKMGARSFKKFFSAFEKSRSVSLQLTQEVLKEREQPQNLVEGLTPQINQGLSKIEVMRQEENILRQHETEIEQNKYFTFPVEVTKATKKDLSGTGQHTTTCRRCTFTCHKDCVYSNDGDKIKCCAMDRSGSCTVCPNHCFWSEHSNLPYVFEYETVMEIRTSEDLKKKYDAAKSGKTKVQGMIEQLEESLTEVHNNVLSTMFKAQQSLKRLDEIALKPNPLTKTEYLELLIESEKSEAKPGWKQRVHYFEQAKRQAEILSKARNPKAAEKLINEEASKEEKWYFRFIFWRS